MFKSFIKFSIKTSKLEMNLDRLTRMNLAFPEMISIKDLFKEEWKLEIRERSHEQYVDQLILASFLLLNSSENNITAAIYAWKSALKTCALRGGSINTNSKLKRLGSRSTKTVF